MAVSAVIPHRNSGLLLDRCLDALADAVSVDEVVVADEESTDGSVERATARPGVRVIASPGEGFAVAINAAIAAARGRWLLLLGSDAFVRPDTVERLRRRLEEEPGLALCGAALVNGDGERTKTHQRLFTLSRAVADALGYRPQVPQEGQGLAHVEAVFPNCALARREAIDQVGGFDERFRFYYEDMDLCRRLAAAGWEMAVDWDAEAVHLAGGSTLSHGQRWWLPQYHRSRLVYLRKHHRRGWLLYAAFWVPKAALHTLGWRFRELVRTMRDDAEGAESAREWAEAFRASILPLR